MKFSLDGAGPLGLSWIDRDVASLSPSYSREYALVVDHAIGERVRLRGGDDDEWGFVTGLVVRPGSIAYQVSWPESKAVTEHYGLELEDAD